MTVKTDIECWRGKLNVFFFCSFCKTRPRVYLPRQILFWVSQNVCQHYDRFLRVTSVNNLPMYFFICYNLATWRSVYPCVDRIFLLGPFSILICFVLGFWRLFIHDNLVWTVPQPNSGEEMFVYFSSTVQKRYQFVRKCPKFMLIK